MRRNRVKMSSIVCGLLIIAAGVLLFAFNAGLLPMAFKHVVFSWPMLLIGLGFAFLFSRDKWVAGVILMFIGSFFILPRLPFFRFYNIGYFVGQNIWAIGLVALGIIVLCKAIFTRSFWYCRTDVKCHSHDWQYKKEEAGYIERNNVFGGSKEKIDITDFKGGDINSVFGGIELDLSEEQKSAARERQAKEQRQSEAKLQQEQQKRQRQAQQLRQVSTAASTANVVMRTTINIMEVRETGGSVGAGAWLDLAQSAVNLTGQTLNIFGVDRHDNRIAQINSGFHLLNVGSNMFTTTGVDRLNAFLETVNVGSELFGVNQQSAALRHLNTGVHVINLAASGVDAVNEIRHTEGVVDKLNQTVGLINIGGEMVNIFGTDRQRAAVGAAIGQVEAGTYKLQTGIQLLNSMSQILQ